MILLQKQHDHVVSKSGAMSVIPLRIAALVKSIPQFKGQFAIAVTAIKTSPNFFSFSFEAFARANHLISARGMRMSTVEIWRAPIDYHSRFADDVQSLSDRTFAQSLQQHSTACQED
jgi:hypothetical protein